jgi:Flp pilus assembly protein TadD
VQSRAARAYTLGITRQYAACEAESRAMLRFDGDNAWAWEALGESLMHLGKKEEGRRALQRCLELDSGAIAADARRVLAEFK